MRHRLLLPLLLLAAALSAQTAPQETDSLYLTPISADLATATVRARRIPAGELASERIRQLDVYLNPAAKADPLLAVNTLPAATNPDETANVSFRGSPSAATGVYLNDVPIRSAVRLDQSNGVGQFSLFGQIPLREVRVYPGHPPVGFSQTSAGAVGLYTSDERPGRISSGVSLHLAGAGLSHERPLGERSGLRAYVNYTNLAAFRFANPDGLPELRRSRAADAAVQFVSRRSDRTTFQFFYLGFQESYRFGVRTPYYTGDFRQRKPRHLAVANWRRTGERWTWRLNQALDWEKPAFSFGNVTTEPRRLTTHLAAHGRRDGAGFSLQTGGAVNTYHDRTRGSFPLTDFGLSPAFPAARFDTAATNVLAEAYAYGQLRLGEHWLLGGGAKPILHHGADRSRYVAQASLRFRPDEVHRITLGGGHFSQYLAPGPDFSFWQWLRLRQVALEYTLTRGDLQLDAAVYAKHEAYERTADLNVRGAEARLRFQNADWLGFVSGAVVRSRSADGEVPTDRDLPFLARAQVQRQFGAQWSVGLAGTWRAGRYFRPVIGRELLAGTPGWYAPVLTDPAAGDRYPAYRRLDLAVSKLLPVGETQLILYLNVNNLLGAENVRAYGYEATFSERSVEVYSRRLVFVGGVLRW